MGLIGYRTQRFPGFHIQDGGYSGALVAQRAAKIADTLAARDALGLQQALVHEHTDGVSLQANIDQVLHNAALAAKIAVAQAAARSASSVPAALPSSTS